MVLSLSEGVVIDGLCALIRRFLVRGEPES